jgi:predicted Zn-dependent peptidase
VLSRADARRHFDTYYGPGNLAAVVVGDFDAAQVKAWAAEYFGRMKARPAPPEVVTLIPEQLAEQRLEAACDCRPQVQVLYRTVPMVHRDRAALEVLAGLLNGRTGRLYRSLVEAQGLASSAFALQTPLKWSGQFSFTAEAKGEATGPQLVAAWDRELERLRRDGVGQEELAKVRNQITADAYRRLKDPSALAMQLLMSDGFGDWRLIEDAARQALAVPAEEVRRVVAKYLRPENRTVGAYARKPAGSAP